MCVRRVLRLGPVIVTVGWLGCNAIIGLEEPEHDLCDGVKCKALDQCGQTDQCDPATGLCVAPNGASCNDGDSCTSPDTCYDGVCSPASDRILAHWNPSVSKTYVVTNDVVVDTVTGRTWQRVVENVSLDWRAAIDYCMALSLPGYPSGWRLPTRIELASVVDYIEIGPSIDTQVFPGTPSDYFWSSSVYAGDPSSAWGVYFNNGDVGAYGKAFTFRVRCVR